MKSLNINDPVEDNDLNSARWTYSWYDSSGVGDGGDAGTENGGSCFDNDNCDTEKYVAAVNAANYCGYSDWRLPTLDELYSIVDFTLPDIRQDRVFFPNLRLGVGSDGRIWSSTPGAEGLGSGGTAWVMSEIGVNQTNKQIEGESTTGPWRQPMTEMINRRLRTLALLTGIVLNGAVDAQQVCDDTIRSATPSHRFVVKRRWHRFR